MSLKEKLQQNQKFDLKLKNDFRSNMTSMAESGILLVEKADGKKLDDEKIIDMLLKEVKEIRESILECKKSKRWDLVCKTKSKIDILLNYLPQQLSKKKLSQLLGKQLTGWVQRA
ncbi:GatB/YqeY domain-containing protein [Clostridium sp. WILCCON 0269]|uniref:GatB/YqeY domain-containing protein n=1 Tax=Candidatus Clostridium eludens TaxID=3381663 RepID=A0ABW8SKS5_9CLOT